METKEKKRPSAQRSRTRESGSSRSKTASRPRAKTAAPAQHRRTTETASATTAARTAKRKRTRAAAQRRKTTVSRPSPDVVYTPAKAFNRNKLLLQLVTVVAVVLAFSFGISVFFKVQVITVSGSDKYDPWTVKEASGIEIGDNLLSFGEAKAAGRIKTALPYVDTVRIGIKLPDTVNIEIKEFDVVYAIRDATDHWWLITAEGKIIERVDGAIAGDNTKIYGVRLANPLIGQQAVAQEDPPPATEETGAAPPITVKGSDRLQAALTILTYLEDCGIIGEAASVDVTDLGNLELWYGQRFQVKLGDTNQLLYKIKCMNAAINGDDPANRLKEYDSGVLDISFTIKTDQIIYQPFTD